MRRDYIKESFTGLLMKAQAALGIKRNKEHVDPAIRDVEECIWDCEWVMKYCHKDSKEYKDAARDKKDFENILKSLLKMRR